MAGLDMRDFRSLDELRGSLYAYVQSYNLAPHSSLRGMSPQDRFFSEPDPLACEPAVHFIFDLVNDDDTVCRNTPFNLQKEVLVDIILRKTADPAQVSLPLQTESKLILGMTWRFYTTTITIAVRMVSRSSKE